MSRDKQIGEMKLIIDKAEEEYSEIWNEWFYDHKEGTKIDNEFLFFAKMLYDAGYRKSTDVAEEIFAEIDKRLDDITIVMGVLDSLRTFHKTIETVTATVDELKKKYTESGRSENDNT